MTAAELFQALTAVPGARALPAPGDGLAQSMIVAGVEIARAEDADERALRRSWRNRYGGGPTPLLVVADDPEAEQCIRALGTSSDGGPIRVVPTDGLLHALESLPGLPELQAVRTLAEELERLDRAGGVSGLQVKGLGTEHLYRTRLRTQTRWQRLAELAAEAPSDWRPLLESFGYELERQARGYLLKHDGRGVAVVHPLADPGAFAKLDAEGRPPEGVLVEQARAERVPYGLLASGSRIRLFEVDPASGSAVARYLELDADSLPDEDRPLLGLLAPESLEGGFDQLMADARAFGAKLRERIDKAIRQDVLPVLGLELGRWARHDGLDPADDDVRHELEAAALTFVFRALFLLYAESAGHLPVGHESYRPHSLTSIVAEARETRDELGSRSTALWRRIGLLVDAMRSSNPAWLVPAYNGSLFAADGFDGAEILERASIPDAALGPALIALGFDEVEQAGYDFSGLEIGHLGHIYEGLLSLRLWVADRRYRYDARADRYVAADPDEEAIEAGELLWLTDEGGRKGGGVYYTPEALVRHLVRRGVVPAFERHLEDVERLARNDAEAAAGRLLEFRVLDPSCGSAHFLVAVVDELADLAARFLGRNPLPALRRQLDDLRAGVGETYGVGVEDVALLRRVVLKHCVYGVDLSSMGAEIAKISLWLASFVPGLSLAYLDHNVKVGNSLIGVADLDGVDIAGDVLRQALEQGAELTLELMQIQDRTPDEVEQSKRIEQQIQATTQEARRELDVWTGFEPAFHWPLEFPEVFQAGGFNSPSTTSRPTREPRNVPSARRSSGRSSSCGTRRSSCRRAPTMRLRLSPSSAARPCAAR